MACVAQGTPLGEQVSEAQIRDLRKTGLIAYPEDLEIDRSRANKNLLAAKTLDESAEISGGLYEVPERFRKK